MYTMYISNYMYYNMYNIYISMYKYVYIYTKDTRG